MRRVAGIGVARRFCTPCLFPRGRPALVTPFACTNLRWILRPCLSKLSYMSHVVWPRERVRDRCLWSHRRDPLALIFRASSRAGRWHRDSPPWSASCGAAAPGRSARAGRPLRPSRRPWCGADGASRPPPPLLAGTPGAPSRRPCGARSARTAPGHGGTPPGGRRPGARGAGSRRSPAPRRRLSPASTEVSSMLLRAS